MAAQEAGAPKRTILWIISNGPAIVTVLGSAAFAVSSTFLKISIENLLQAVLGLLALIGASLLVDRLIASRELSNRLERVDEKLDNAVSGLTDGQLSLDRLVVSRRDLAPLENRMDGAREIFISGGSLFRLVNEYRRLFELLAEQGCRMRFWMVDPESAAAEHLGQFVAYEANSLDNYKAHMRDAISGLSHLSKAFPQNCEVALSQVVPPFSLVLIRKDGEPAVMQVELYPFGVPARDRPLLLLKDDRDQRLFRLFSQQAEKMWSLPSNQKV